LIYSVQFVFCESISNKKNQSRLLVGACKFFQACLIFASKATLNQPSRAPYVAHLKGELF
jgi:hypothetical protein